ncbi:MAG: hypothetical protein FJ197_07065 [Gammaproteobacteria bacterium]|nr:hypothetical protein [Gammaproteobacteria bacterium]
MVDFSRARRALATALLAGFGCVSASAINIDVRGTLGPYGGFGNSLNYSAGGVNVSLYGWAETGALQTSTPSNFWLFQTAEIYSWSTGVGVCNRVEGTLASGNCSVNEQEIDTVGSRDDLIVLYFDQIVSFGNLQVTVDPWDGPGSDPNDRDLRFWVATVASGAPNLSTYSFNTLSTAFGTSYLSSVISSYDAYTHLLGSVIGPLSGNLLMISGNWFDRSCVNRNSTADKECEAWQLASIDVDVNVIPVPAAVWLLGSALGLLGWMRRRSA